MFVWLQCRQYIRSSMLLEEVVDLINVLIAERLWYLILKVNLKNQGVVQGMNFEIKKMETDEEIKGKA